MQNNITPTQPQSPQQSPAPDTNAQQKAADAARTQLDHIYTQNPPNQLKTEQPANEQTGTNPYHQTHQENFDWRNYHSAWQNYYQQYYQRYYGQQLEAEKQKLSTSAPATSQEVVTGADTSLTQKTKITQLKQDIIDTVKTHAKKARGSHHFVPIASAVAVGLVFLFLQFNNVMVAQVKAYVSPGNLSNDALIVDPTVAANVGPEPKLVIPKINVDIPIDYNVTSLSEAEIQNSLRDGATHYKLPGADAVPGQFGNTVILGHSSNDIFNQGKYKFVFVLLDRLKPGDTFYLNYDSKRYIYKVTETKVIDPTEIGALQIGNEKPMATLVTCTPPGTALKRLVIFGEQISPDPSADKPANTSPVNQPQNTALPGIEPNWLDGIWSFFF